MREPNGCVFPFPGRGLGSGAAKQEIKPVSGSRELPNVRALELHRLYE